MRKRFKTLAEQKIDEAVGNWFDQPHVMQSVDKDLGTAYERIYKNLVQERFVTLYGEVFIKWNEVRHKFLSAHPHDWREAFRLIEGDPEAGETRGILTDRAFEQTFDKSTFGSRRRKVPLGKDGGFLDRTTLNGLYAGLHSLISTYQAGDLKKALDTQLGTSPLQESLEKRALETLAESLVRSIIRDLHVYDEAFARNKLQRLGAAESAFWHQEVQPMAELIKTRRLKDKTRVFCFFQTNPNYQSRLLNLNKASWDSFEILEDKFHEEARRRHETLQAGLKKGTVNFLEERALQRQSIGAWRGMNELIRQTHNHILRSSPSTDIYFVVSKNPDIGIDKPQGVGIFEKDDDVRTFIAFIFFANAEFPDVDDPLLGLLGLRGEADLSLRGETLTGGRVLRHPQDDTPPELYEKGLTGLTIGQLPAVEDLFMHMKKSYLTRFDRKGRKEMARFALKQAQRALANMKAKALVYAELNLEWGTVLNAEEEAFFEGRRGYYFAEIRQQRSYSDRQHALYETRVKAFLSSKTDTFNLAEYYQRYFDISHEEFSVKLPMKHWFEFLRSISSSPKDQARDLSDFIKNRLFEAMRLFEALQGPEKEKRNLIEGLERLSAPNVYVDYSKLFDIKNDEFSVKYPVEHWLEVLKSGPPEDQARHLSELIRSRLFDALQGNKSQKLRFIEGKSHRDVYVDYQKLQTNLEDLSKLDLGPKSLPSGSFLRNYTEQDENIFYLFDAHVRSMLDIVSKMASIDEKKIFENLSSRGTSVEPISSSPKWERRILKKERRMLHKFFNLAPASPPSTPSRLGFDQKYSTHSAELEKTLADLREIQDQLNPIPPEQLQKVYFMGEWDKETFLPQGGTAYSGQKVLDRVSKLVKYKVKPGCNITLGRLQTNPPERFDKKRIFEGWIDTAAYPVVTDADLALFVDDKGMLNLDAFQRSLQYGTPNPFPPENPLGSVYKKPFVGPSCGEAPTPKSTWMVKHPQVPTIHGFKYKEHFYTFDNVAPYLVNVGYPLAPYVVRAYDAETGYGSETRTSYGYVPPIPKRDNT